MFGLSEREFCKLMRMIMVHAAEFKKVILFGSRARGDYKAHSDIDLAIRYAHRQKTSSFQADFQSALAQLHEALSKDIQSDSMYLDATIQRFEFTDELCWKLMKAYLDYFGIEVNNLLDLF